MNIVVANPPCYLDNGKGVILFPSRWDSGELRNVSPSLASDDLLDATLGQSELPCQSALAATPCVKTAYFRDLFSGKYCTTNSFALWLSLLCASIRHVVDVSTEKQMDGIAARWIIAFVQNLKAIGNWAICINVRNAMGSAFAKKGAITNVSVPIPTLWPIPLPALVGAALINVRPKTIFPRVFAWQMSSNITLWLSSCRTSLRVTLRSNGCGLTTTAHTQARGIRGFGSEIRKRSVSTNKTEGMPLFMTKRFFVLKRQICSVAATALALTVLKTQPMPSDPRGIFSYVFGKVWGMITHVVSPPKTCGHSHGRLQRRVAISIGFTPVSIAQTGVLDK